MENVKPNLFINNNYLNKKISETRKKKNIPIFIIKNKNIDKLHIFFNEMNNNKENIIGIDFEFNNINNKRHVALIQINFNNDFILMFDPSSLNIKLKKKFKNLLFDVKNKKLLHGAESLDIPYLFNEFFDNENEKKKFLYNYFDTKFICDYLNIRDNLENKKCKILLLVRKYNIIDDKILKILLDNEEKMGPIYNVFVNVNNMNEKLIKYSLFDVYYLIDLFNILPINDNELKSINYFFFHTLLYKKDIENELNIINEYNNNFIIINKNIYTLSFIFEFIINMLNTQNFNYNIIYDIPYLKKYFSLIIKNLIYNYIIYNYVLFVKDNKVNNNNILFNFDKNKDFEILKQKIKQLLD